MLLVIPLSILFPVLALVVSTVACSAPGMFAPYRGAIVPPRNG